jgi:formamidase
MRSVGQGGDHPTGAQAFLVATSAAVFLGATIIEPQRFNDLGTLIAVDFQVTGITGLQLPGVQAFVHNLLSAARCHLVALSPLIPATRGRERSIGARMSFHRIELDLTTSLSEDHRRGHNRWHPDIEPTLRVAPGDLVEMDLRDGLDYQIWPHSGVEDVVALDVTRGHPLTGPVYVEGAEPGDLLDVEILEVRPATDFGFTLIAPGLGLLAYRFSEPFLVKWQITDGVARSEQMPGIAVPGDPFLGVIGVAPAPGRMAEFARREAVLAETGAFVMQPEPRNAVPADQALSRIAIRTVPPRENGGNMDIPRLTEGSSVQLPVEVPGALLSVGDTHFAQGDGESCGVAIEIAARALLRIGLRKKADLTSLPGSPMYRFRERSTREYLATTGVPVTAEGENRFMDVNLAAVNALGELVDYLVADRRLRPEQAYVLVSVAADLHISSIVNIPNALVSAALPLDVFV